MSKTEEQFIREIADISPTIEIIGRYTKAVERIEVRCKICGHVWNPKAYSLTQGKGCPHCSALKGSLNNKGRTGRKTSETFIKELAAVLPDVEVNDEYVGNKVYYRCHCKRCGNEWSAKGYSLLQGHGCPRCAKSGTSFMEQFILLSFCKALGNNSVVSRDRNTIGKELDILIPSIGVAIEPGNWQLHEKRLDKDIEKRTLCQNAGVRLITIYDKYPQALEPPFPTNCIVFPEDYNKADHKHIIDLVKELFKECGIDTCFTASDWEDIEMNAYKKAKAVSHDDFIARLSEINPNVEVLGEYHNSNRRLSVRCKKCSFEWNALPSSLLAGDGCRKCGTIAAHKNALISQEEFISRVNAVNTNVEIIGEYKGRHQTVKAKCKVCGYEWNPVASSLLRGSSHKGAVSIHKKRGQLQIKSKNKEGN